MLKMMLLCACLIQALAVQSMVDVKEPDTYDVSSPAKKTVLYKDRHSGETGTWNQGKSNTLFARRGTQEWKKVHALKPKQELVLPFRRCSRVMESCIPHSLCCDPCASCHCRFFNAICYCRRLNRHCQKKT
ncbi:agouti-signaling protein 2b [Amia ocellicauda]|uniref:agouti-signaling protein 2b n=1 Tax=Amia ocellicauda TaxID=2972642 RepID=UPI0034642E83